MALFTKDKDKKKDESSEKQSADVSAGKGDEGSKGASKAHTGSMYWVLKRPHLTEKATNLFSYNAYVFDVDMQANKTQIARAVEEIYNVTPVKIRTLNQPNKHIRTRKGMGTRTRGKKAIVYLKEGDSIQFM